MEKYCYLRYFRYGDMFADKDGKTDVCGSEETYTTEEELNQKIKEFNEYLKEERGEKFLNSLEMEVIRYTNEEYLAKEFEEIKGYIEGLRKYVSEMPYMTIDELTREKKYYLQGEEITYEEFAKLFTEGIEKIKSPNKALCSKQDPKTLEWHYYKKGVEISKKEFDEEREELDFRNRLKSIRYFKDRISSERIIRRTFDVLKLTVNDFDRCINKLSLASYNRQSISEALNKLKEDYKYALNK